MSMEQETSAGAAACTYCGNTYGPTDLVCPRCSFPTPLAGTKAAADARRARLRVRLVVAGVALAVVGGSAVLLLGGDDEVPPATGGTPTATGTTDGTGEGPRPLQAAWTAALDSSVIGELGVGDGVVVSLDSGDLVSLDPEGGTTWSAAQPSGPFAALDATGEVVVSAEVDAPGIGANAVADGAELWRYPDITYVGVADAGVVVDVEAEGGRFGVLDAQSGVPAWSVPDVDAYAVAGAMAYVRRGPEVSALSTADGSVLWTTDVGAGSDATLVANLGLVAVVKGAEVVALDPLNGTRRWTARVRGAAVELFSDEVVVVTGKGATASAVAYDASGERGAVPTEGGVPAGLVPFTVAGESYALDPVYGSVLDADLTAIASYDGTLVPAPDGVYVVADGLVSHYPLGASTPDVSAEVAGATRVVPLADGFAVVSGDTVTGFR